MDGIPINFPTDAGEGLVGLTFNTTLVASAVVSLKPQYLITTPVHGQR